MESQFSFEDLVRSYPSLQEDVKEIKSLILGIASSDKADSIFTIQETADFLHVQKQTLYSYVSRGIIPHHKRAGRLYFSKNDLIQWVKEGNKRSFDVEAAAQKIISKRKGGSHE